MADNEDRSWITVGARVAEYKHVSGGPDGVRLSRVEKLTAKQIVLDNGMRYRRDDLHAISGSGGAWRTEWWELMQPDDQQVRYARARTRLRMLDKRVSEIVRDLGVTATPEQLIAAVDAIDQAAAEARARIIGLTEED